METTPGPNGESDGEEGWQPEPKNVPPGKGTDTNRNQNDIIRRRILEDGIPVPPLPRPGVDDNVYEN